jgi:hypothetical protein
MLQSNQENSARMRFDTTLPPDVCSELLRPRRARILTRPPPPPQRPPAPDSARSRWHPAVSCLLALAALAGVVAVIAVLATSWPKALQESADRSRETQAAVAKALDALRTPDSIKPAVQLTPAATPSGVVPAPAPRAMLVKLPPPRAMLVKLPPWRINESRLLDMPYGERVVGTLRGFLENENQLPQVGQIGDTWMVQNIPWIWTVAPGASKADWIDP